MSYRVAIYQPDFPDEPYADDTVESALDVISAVAAHLEQGLPDRDKLTVEKVE